MKVKLLIVVIFMLIVGGFGKGEVSDYQRDSTIQNDPVAVVANITSHDVTSKTKKGHTTDTYSIKYEYLVDGVAHGGVVSLTNDSGESAVNRGTFDVVYSKSSPGVHALKSQYHDGRTITGLMWALAKLVVFGLIMAPLAGLLMAWKFGWLKKKQEEVEAAQQET